MTSPHVHQVQVYYEDTDHSGVVYHANYLKFFERAREHFFGVQALCELAQGPGLGFVVYRASMAFHKGAVFGDTLRIESTPSMPSPFRASFHQRALRERDNQCLVEATIELVLIDSEHRPVAFPDSVLATLTQ